MGSLGQVMRSRNGSYLRIVSATPAPGQNHSEGTGGGGGFQGGPLDD